MSNISCLNKSLLKLIYSSLSLPDKFNFSLTNKKFHDTFYNYPLLDFVYEVSHDYACEKGKFLFNNIVNISMKSAKMYNSYFAQFKNLREVYFEQMQCESFERAKNLVLQFPNSLIKITVLDDDTKELFKLASHITKKPFSVTCLDNKKRHLEPSFSSLTKRIRTPSPVASLFDKQLKALLLAKSRMKYAMISPGDFIPPEISRKFPDIPTEYKAVIDSCPFHANLLNNASEADVEAAIKVIKDIVIHSIVKSQENNWIFVTQAEAYYHQKSLDDVAQVNNKDEYPKSLEVNIEKREEGKGTWYELRFRCQKIEIVATGGFYNDEYDTNKKLGAFLGVSAPYHMAQDSNLILFSPTVAVETLSCIRMLRNYRRKASLNKWCFKSVFFATMNFVTPDQFRLNEQVSQGYESVCSELLNLTINGELSGSNMEALERKMIIFEYWKSLGFQKLESKENILERLEQMKKEKKTKGYRISKSKKLLIEIILNRQLQISNESLMILYNGIIYGKIKSINDQRVKEIK